jgi:hypothetical protein
MRVGLRRLRAAWSRCEIRRGGPRRDLDISKRLSGCGAGSIRRTSLFRQSRFAISEEIRKSFANYVLLLLLVSYSSYAVWLLRLGGCTHYVVKTN